MSSRRRLWSLSVLGVLALAVVVVVWAGLRSRPSTTARASAATLVTPRFSRPPKLALGVLTAGSIPQPLRSRWTRAAADGEVALTELRGYPIVLNFWASWCAPCRREAPLLMRAWRAEHGRVLFLGVNQNDAADDARAFVRRFATSYPSVRESGDRTARRWGVGGFPVTFFLSAGGRVVAQTIGQLRRGQLERGIAAARRGSL